VKDTSATEFRGELMETMTTTDWQRNVGFSERLQQTKEMHV
jgi:hypothetical protein